MNNTLEDLEARLQIAIQEELPEEARLDALLALAWHVKSLDPQRGVELSEQAVACAKSSDEGQRDDNGQRLGSGLGVLGTCLCLLGRPDEALPLLEEGLARCRSSNALVDKDHRAEARCHYGLGVAQQKRLEIALAGEHYKTAAGLFGECGDACDQAGCYNKLAGILRDSSDFSAALFYCVQAKQLCEEVGDRVGFGSALGNIGNLYGELGDHVRAFEFHQQCLQTFQKTDYSLGICRALGALAGDHVEVQQYEKAVEASQEALTLAIELETVSDQIAALSNLGCSYMHLGSLGKAEKAFRQSLALARGGSDCVLTCSALSHFGELLHQQNKKAEARLLFTECIEVGGTINNIRLPSEAHRGLANIAQDEGDFEAALHHHQQYHALHEKVFSEDADKRSKLLFIQMEVETARQEAEIHRLKTVELAEANAHLEDANARLEALATTDPLTGRANHRALVAALDLEMERCHRYTRSCALLFLDIDHFKTLNDSYGHPVGDAVLREFAALVQSCLRGPDTLGRWGGEEFIALLPETDKAGADLLAERVRAAVASRIFAAGGGLHLTCSVGVAESPAHGANRDALIKSADQAVYAAKHLGRNQVRLADDPAVTLLAAVAESGREETALTGVVQALATLVTVRDAYTGEHHENVGGLTMRLALALNLDTASAHQVGLAARLHDIGKVGVPDAILHKQARLTECEWERIRQHPEIGAKIVSHVPGLRPLAPLIRSHHERWDGKGYPDRLAGDAIPLGARILAVADAWGAMTTDRPYRAAQCEERAEAELTRGAGTQFDPSVVQAFLEMRGFIT